MTDGGYTKEEAQRLQTIQSEVANDAALETRTAPLNEVYVAPENPRADRPAENAEEIAANIKAHGVLEPLLCYPGGGGFMAVDGRRRLAGLERLLADRSIEQTYAVPIKVCSKEQAIELALSIAHHRVGLHPADEAKSWGKMVDAGDAPDAIAKVMGVTERFVRERLKLAALHPPILEALASDAISLDLAELYAGAEREKQEAAWKNTGAEKGRIDAVKKELFKRTLGAGDKLAKFVGEEAYVAAGGRVAFELFGEAKDARWQDVKIAQRLAGEKIEAIRAELEAEGWSFVHAALEEPTYGTYVDGNLAKQRKPTKEEAARLAAIKKELVALNKSWDDESLTADADDKLIAKQDALEAERDAFEAALQTYDDAAKKKGGAIAYLDRHRGNLVIARGQVVKKAPSAKKTGASASKPPPPEDISREAQRLLENASEEIVGHALAHAPQFALAVAAAALARALLEGPGADATKLTGVDENYSDRCALLSDGGMAELKAGWKARLKGKWERAVEEIASWPFDDQLQLFAFCMGHTIVAESWGIEQKEARDEIGRLGKLLRVAPADYLQPDADLLEGFAPHILLGYAAELKIVSAPKDKRGLAETIAAAAKEKGWVPPLLNELCLGRVSPKPKAKADVAPKAKKKAAPKKSAEVKKAKPAAKKIAKPDTGAAKKKAGRPKKTKPAEAAAS